MPIYSFRQLADSAQARASAITFALLLLAAPAVIAQSPGTIVGVRGGLSVNGELENYLRYVTARDSTTVTPWSLRRFTPTEVARVVAHADSAASNPWASSWMFERDSSRAFSVVPLVISVRYNSTYPYGYNDGPVWAGKGMTGAASGGFAARLGALSVVVDPTVFIAQNASFPLQPNGHTGVLRFADADFPTTIDHPQRFGASTYSRFYPGETTIELNAFGASVGATTANQWWGPASTFPPILGNNAPGVPSVYFGTDNPKFIGIGLVHARVVYGLESQSDVSPVIGSDSFVNTQFPGRRRFMSGMVGVYQPKWIPHLELGGARYFHMAWEGHVTAADLKQPFAGLLKSTPSAETGPTPPATAVSNQLASAFFRWVFPMSGLDLYGEYARDDHNANLRDFAEEPDHSRMVMAGFRKSFARRGAAFSAFRIEYLDATDPTLDRHRDEGGIYTHTVLRQGHTEDGRLIGAPIGVGAFAGGMIAWDHFSNAGRTSWFLQRNSVNNSVQLLRTGTANYAASQLSGTLGYEQYRIRRTADVMYGASLTDSKRGPSLRPSLNLSLMIRLVPHGN